MKKLLRSFPALLLLDPRECGKSTWVRHALPDWTYLDLERPADFGILTADLEGYFDAHPRRGARARAPHLSRESGASPPLVF